MFFLLKAHISYIQLSYFCFSFFEFVKTPTIIEKKFKKNQKHHLKIYDYKDKHIFKSNLNIFIINEKKLIHQFSLNSVQIKL